jgi:hypothetical protein
MSGCLHGPAMAKMIGMKASKMRDFGKGVRRDMAGTKVLADGAGYIPRKILVLSRG